MITKQLSVFIENRKGRLGEVLNVLKENDVNIQSLSLADTTEYGLLRLIVDKPEEVLTPRESTVEGQMSSEIPALYPNWHMATQLPPLATILSPIHGR